MMTRSAQRDATSEQPEPNRVLGRGLRARRGVRLSLRALREAAGKTQVDVANEAQMDQGDVSRLERRESFDDCQLATLRRYIEALGGQLEVTATLGTKRISVVGSTKKNDVSGAEQRTRAERRRQRYPGQIIEAGTPKPPLYTELSLLDRLAHLTALSRRMAILSGTEEPPRPRSQWPGEVFHLEKP